MSGTRSNYAMQRSSPLIADVEAAWLEEAHRRGHEIDTGQAELLPADEVFRKLKAAAAFNHPH